MSKVIFTKASYDYKPLRQQVFALMDTLGGSSIASGCKVLIKPNLLAPAPPEKAVVTHPFVVKAVVEYVLERGALPQISDSPAIGSFERIMRESGLSETLRGLPVACSEFRVSSIVEAESPFHRIEVAEDALKADVVINLPKLKTHTQMLLTLGVKNMFGCVVGIRKPEWHFRTGIDRDMFARLLVSVCRAVSPSITLIDGILAMEGQGPGRSGQPKPLGIFLGSDDVYALDRVVCRMLGINPDELFTNVAAKEKGLIRGPITIEGEMPSIKEFKLPQITSLVFGPKRLHGMMRRHLIQRPVIDAERCLLCGECIAYCPAKVMQKKGNDMTIDYKNCIRCYCCVEICQHSALMVKEPVPARILRKFRRK